MAIIRAARDSIDEERFSWIMVITIVTSGAPDKGTEGHGDKVTR
jgi:hypothetical protein